MSSKRKTEEIDTRNVIKGLKTDVSSYLEEQREKLLKDCGESLDNIMNYVVDSLHDLAFKPTQNLICYCTRRNRSLRKFQQLKTRESDPLVTQNPLWFSRRDGAEASSQRNFDMTHDFAWDSQFTSSSSTVCYVPIADTVINILRNWNLDLYLKCIEECNVLKEKDPDIWANFLLRVFPYALLQHCTRTDIIADYFHLLCNEPNVKQLIMSDMELSYLQFFLMNMSLVNRIEYSVILESDMWISMKKKLFENAFLLGKVDHLHLFLQYFSNDLWSRHDWETLELYSIKRVWTIYCADKTEAVCYDDMTTLLTILISIHSVMSLASCKAIADCIRLFWRASEMPYTSQKHIEEIFTPCRFMVCNKFTSSGPSMSVFRCGILRTYPKEFLLDYQPRSLMHLSRCKIRQSLTSPLHVHFLPLPDTMKKYLNLEW